MSSNADQETSSLEHLFFEMSIFFFKLSTIKFSYIKKKYIFEHFV